MKADPVPRLRLVRVRRTQRPTPRRLALVCAGLAYLAGYAAAILGVLSVWSAVGPAALILAQTCGALAVAAVVLREGDYALRAARGRRAQRCIEGRVAHLHTPVPRQRPRAAPLAPVPTGRFVRAPAGGVARRAQGPLSRSGGDVEWS